MKLGGAYEDGRDLGGLGREKGGVDMIIGSIHI